MNNQRVIRGTTPGQQQQRRILIAQKTTEEQPANNPRNIRVTTQVQQKYIPSATRSINNGTLRQNQGGIIESNLNQNRGGENAASNQGYGGSVLQSTNRITDRQQTLIKQNNEINQRNNIIPNISGNQQNAIKSSGQQQAAIKNEQKPSFMIRKTNNTTTIPNKSTVVNNSSQAMAQKNTTVLPQKQNPTVAEMTSSTRSQQNGPIGNTTNTFQSPVNPARKYREQKNLNENSSSISNQMSSSNQNNNTTTIPSLSSLNGNISSNPNNSSISNSQIPSTTNLHNASRPAESSNINAIRRINTNATQPQSIPSTQTNTNTITATQQIQNNNNIVNNNNTSSVRRISNQTSSITQTAQVNDNIFRQPPSINSINNPVASQLTSIRGNDSNLQRPNENTSSNSTTQIRAIRADHTIANNNNASSTATAQSNQNNIASQRLTGPNSQWLRDTQSAIQNINSILSQTNNALNRAENLTNNQNTGAENNSSSVRNSRINPFSPANANSNNRDANRQSSAIEEMQRDLELLSNQRRFQEQQILARQAFEDRMARANHQVRQIMRDDYRRNNYGRNMSDFSSSQESDIESEEEQKVNINSTAANRLARNRFQPSSDSDSDSNEEEIKENRERDRGRQFASSSLPPIRNSSNSNNVLQLNFRNRAQVNQPEQNSEGQSQPMAQRLGLGFDMIYNGAGRSADPSSRAPGSVFQRLMDQSNQNNNASSNNNNNNNNNNNSPRTANNRDADNQGSQNQNGETRLFRIFLPVNGNSTTQRSMIEGLRNLFINEMNNSLGNIQGGSISNARLEDITQLIATIRLLQSFTQSRKLSEEQIKEFPVVKLKEIEENELCSICLDEWQINDEAKLLGCMHKFHPRCIDDWLKEKTICPNCKEDQLQFFSDKIPENLQQQQQS